MTGSKDIQRNQIQELISSKQIQERIPGLAREIETKVGGSEESPLLILCVLKGAFIFAADLVRELNIPCEIDFVRLSSYGSQTQSSGEVDFVEAVSVDVRGRNVLVVEDIVDTGLTLTALKKDLMNRGAQSVSMVTLLDKQARREVELKVDFKAFDVGNEFVVGFGLDFDQKFRELPFVGVISQDESE